LKGNVSLLIILVLLASSVIALLSINQIQRLLVYWNMTFNYFRAFYLAKAGTELWLTEVYYREAGFKQTINSGNAIVSKNLIWAYSGFNPYFTMNIEWNFKTITDDIRYTDECRADNKITLGTWEWIMLSLFNDKTSWVAHILTTTNENNIKGVDDKFIKTLNIVEKETSWGFQYFTFWLFNYDKNRNMWNIFVKTWTNLQTFLWENIGSVEWNRRYLTIKNPWTGNEVVSFCIEMNWKLIPYSNSLITVRGNYGDMEVWLQSVVEKEVPFWAMDVLWL